MKKETSSDWRKIVETSAARGYSLAIATLTLIIVARLLGPEGQGTVAAALAWAGLIAAVAGLSLGQVSQHRIQKRRASAWDGKIFGSLLVLLLGLSLAAYLFVITAYGVTRGQFFGNLPASVIALAFALVPLLIWEEYASNLLAGAGRIRAYNRVHIVGRSIGLVLLLILLLGLGAGVRGALGAQLAAQAIITFGLFAVLYRLHRPAFRRVMSEVRQLAAGALRLHFNTIGAFLLAHSSVLVLNEFTSKAAVGWYHVAWHMIAVLAIVPQAASLILYGKIGADGPDGAWPAHKRIMIRVLAVMVLLSLVGYALGPTAIVYLAGERFQPSAELFRILLPALLGMSLAQLMAPQWISRGIFVPTSVVTAVTGALHVGITIALVRRDGVFGAAWATALTLATVPLVVQGYFAWWCERQYRRSVRGLRPAAM